MPQTSARERKPLLSKFGRERERARPIRTPAKWPLRFVVASLVLLATVPAYLGQRIASAEREISQVLDPARDLSAELAFVHSREMSRFQGYLLTGEPLYRERYEALQQREQEVFSALSDRLERTDLRIRALQATLYTAAIQWKVNHSFALAGDQQRRDYLANQIQAEQSRYDEVLAAAQVLTAALTTEVQAARVRMDRARDLQAFLTVALAALALLASGATGVIGGRLRALVRESEQRRAEALRVRREIEAVLEGTADGVMGLDLEGRVATLNRAGARLLGCPEVDAVGRTVHELIHGHAPEGHPHPASACPVLAALRSGEREHGGEDQIWRRDGSSFPAKWQLRPLLDGRDVRGGVLTLTDMTEVRTAEAALKQAVHARDQVVAVVSHDLRNPLGTVSGAAALLLELDLPEHKRTEQLRVIRRSALRMSRLIEDLLDVSRIEGGGLVVEPRPQDLASLLREATELEAPLAGERGLTLSCEAPPNLPPVVCDHDRVLQVLSNLLGNAFKHTPAGGSVTVSVRPGEGQVTVSVTDTGEGIAAADLGRLFDRYWQVRSSGRAGVGLGLTIVKGIVEAHGGRVWVESELGLGTAFHVTFPTATAADAPSLAVLAPHGSGQPQRTHT